MTTLGNNIERFIVPPIREIAAELDPSDPLRQYLSTAPADGVVADGFNRWMRGKRDLPLGLPGQIDGDWFSDAEHVPPTEPAWYPTGALLPAVGRPLEVGTNALTLVPIDYVWFPLSEAARNTYSHSIGLGRGERWVFVPRSSSGVAWPTVFNVALGKATPTTAIRAQFGEEAERRARSDWDTVVLTITGRT